MSHPSDRASDSGPRRGVTGFVVDNKTQIGLGVVLSIIALTYFVGKQVQKSESEKSAVETQMSSMREENHAALAALHVEIANLASTINIRGESRDREMRELYKRVDKNDEQIEKLGQLIMQWKQEQRKTN